MCCFVLAAGALAGGIALFGTGFVGPAPIALAGSGGLIAAGVSLWRPATPRKHYPVQERPTHHPD